MENQNKKYIVPQEEAVMVAEPVNVAINSHEVHGKQKVNVSQLLADGYMTLTQSQTIIENKIHSHFLR